MEVILEDSKPVWSKVSIFPGNNAFSDFFTLSLVNTVVLAVVGAIVTAVAGPVGMAIIAGAVLLNGVMNEGVNKAYYGEDYSWEQFATGIGMAILEAAASFAMAGASAATAAASGVAKVGTSAAGGAAKVGMSALSAGARVGVSVGMAAGQFLNKFLVQQTVSGFSSLKNGKLDTGKHWKNTKSFVRANVGSFAASVVGAAIGSGIGLGMDKMKFKTGFGESIVNMAVNKGLGVGMNAMAAKIDGRSYKFDPLKEFMNGSFISSAVMAGVAAGGDIKALKAANAAREMQRFNESRDGESPFDNPENRKLFATASKSGRRKILDNLEKLSGDGDWDSLSSFQKNELTWQTLNNDFDSTRLVATMKQMASRNNSMDTSNVFANNNFDSIGNVGLPRFTMTAPRNSVGTSGVSSDGNYSFASGDNPTKLAQRFGVSTDQVVSYLNKNNIFDMTKIPVGTTVNLNGIKTADGSNAIDTANSGSIVLTAHNPDGSITRSAVTPWAAPPLTVMSGGGKRYSTDEMINIFENSFANSDYINNLYGNGNFNSYGIPISDLISTIGNTATGFGTADDAFNAGSLLYSLNKYKNTVPNINLMPKYATPGMTRGVNGFSIYQTPRAPGIVLGGISIGADFINYGLSYSNPEKYGEYDSLIFGWRTFVNVAAAFPFSAPVAAPIAIGNMFLPNTVDELEQKYWTPSLPKDYYLPPSFAFPNTSPTIDSFNTELQDWYKKFKQNPDYFSDSWMSNY